MENEQNTVVDENGERPPIFSSWKTLYTIVFVNLIVLIALFWIITRTFQ